MGSGEHRTVDNNDATDHHNIFTRPRSLSCGKHVTSVTKRSWKREARRRKWLPWQSRDDNDVGEAWRRTSCHHPCASSGLIRPSAHLHSYRGECSRTYLLEEYGRLRWGRSRESTRENAKLRAPVKMDTSPSHPREVDSERGEIRKEREKKERKKNR